MHHESSRTLRDAGGRVRRLLPSAEAEADGDADGDESADNPAEEDDGDPAGGNGDGGDGDDPAKAIVEAFPVNDDGAQDVEVVEVAEAASCLALRSKATAAKEDRRLVELRAQGFSDAQLRAVVAVLTTASRRQRKLPVHAAVCSAVMQAYWAGRDRERREADCLKAIRNDGGQLGPVRYYESIIRKHDPLAAAKLLAEHHADRIRAIRYVVGATFNEARREDAIAKGVEPTQAPPPSSASSCCRRRCRRGRRRARSRSTRYSSRSSRPTHRNPVTPISKPFLELALAGLPKGQEQYRRWQNLRRDVLAACKRAGVPDISLNDLRRSFATWHLEAGVSNVLVAKYLGHTTTEMVDRIYGRPSVESLKKLTEEHFASKKAAAKGGEPKHETKDGDDAQKPQVPVTIPRRRQCGPQEEPDGAPPLH